MYRQRALGVAILAGLLALGFDRWGDAVRRGASFETREANGLQYLEAISTGIAALALTYYALCLVTTRPTDVS